MNVIGLNHPTALLFLLLLPLALFNSAPQAADIAGYMEFKKKLEARERALSGVITLKNRAMNGDVEAQYEFAMANRYAWGMDKSNSDAALWFREAADAGHARAQLELGLMYEFGEGVPLNLKRAHTFYHRAAKQDLREARISLALIRGKMLKVEEYLRNHHKPNYNKPKEKEIE